FLFFFSSRRRHTRSYGDWSSDVCSSDLARPSSIDRHPETWKPPMATAIPALRNGAAMSRARGYWFDWTPTTPTNPKLPCDRKRRSEERRVGKECRSGWPQCNERRKRTDR